MATAAKNATESTNARAVIYLLIGYKERQNLFGDYWLTPFRISA